MRSQARILRQKLEEYFEHEGRNEPLRIVVPKGSYVPQFIAVSLPAPSSPEADGSSTDDPQFAILTTPPRFLSTRNAAVALAMAFLLFSGLLATDIWIRTRVHVQTSDESERLWSNLFGPQQRTIIVPSDSTLILLEELTKGAVNIADYSDHTYLNRMTLPRALEPMTIDDLASHKYTSMADLNMVARLSKLPETAHARVEIRYARDLALSDVKEANVVLIGGERANPWAALFERETKFHVNYDSTTKNNTVVDLAPAKGGPASYVEQPTSTDRPAYGVVSFVPGKCNGCDALLVQGTSMAGTEGASDFLFRNPKFSEFLHNIARRDGSIPHFELLLQTMSVGGNAPEASILAYHLLP